MNQQQLEEAILELQNQVDPESIEQSITISDIRTASPYVLALVGALRVALAPMGKRKIKVGGISITVDDLLNALLGTLTGVTQ